MITLFQKFWKEITLVLIALIIIIIFRKKIRKKLEKETITFFSALISVGLFAYGYYTEPEIETQALATILGREVSIVIPLVWVFAVILVISLIILFRQELSRDI